MNRKERRRLTKLGRGPHRGGNGADQSDVAETLLPQAITYLQGGLAQDALQICEQILVSQPEHPDTINIYAVAYFHLGEVERRITSYNVCYTKLLRLGAYLQRLAIGSFGSIETADRSEHVTQIVVSL